MDGTNVKIVNTTKYVSFSAFIVIYLVMLTVNLCNNYVVTQWDGEPQLPLVVKVELSTALNDTYFTVLPINLPNNCMIAQWDV
jgi:hypothetical protein